MMNDRPLEISELLDRIAKLEGRCDALSIVLHSSIIMSEDALKRHIDGIVMLISGLAESHQNPHAATVLREWVAILQRDSKP
ncbi:hypothetical protein EOW65_06670 [Sinirhodobacter ferrireducens]|uniref:Uncharacterized protein n=1 Tax=Paenirhodobacter ferrireducens TaxID=1215032 RepID=A0A443LN92_9RHOB|nr:hypothetical protein [Sinirhodobacter ferrireducens]RWR50630.1 hypothetical protein EOW65_06670 [Sinirhodobacter ferrireducens]